MSSEANTRRGSRSVAYVAPKLICPVCFESGIEAIALLSHIRDAHGMERAQAERLAHDADVDPLAWLLELRSVEDDLDWVLARLESTGGGRVRESLLLAAAVLEGRRAGLMEAGHAGRSQPSHASRVRKWKPSEG